MELQLVIILLLQLEIKGLSVPPPIMDRHGIMEHLEQQVNYMRLHMETQHLSLLVIEGPFVFQVIMGVHGMLEPGAKLRFYLG